MSAISRRWFSRLAPAVAILVATLSCAKADPRIDEENASALVEMSPVTGSIVEQRGRASWYGSHWRGRRTASGVRFDDRLLTAASVSLPLATHARVTNLQNGRSVDLVVNDRGP